MNFKNKKQAYTLAEIMLVILVLTIIFAAMAPIITKRKTTQFTSKYNVWSYVDLTNFDASYNPGDPSFTGQLFFGITPSDANSVTSEFVPLSKIIIRGGTVTSSDKLQRQIQFRYGRTNSNKNGTFAGTWYVNRKNILLGGSYKDLNYNESVGARDNVAVGYDALTSLVAGRGNVAIGYRALSTLTSSNNNVAIGTSAALKNKKEKNVFIGSQSGLNATADKTVAIGYQAGVGSITQPQNLIVGAFAGGGLDSSSMGLGNTAIGYAALGKLNSGEGNVAIGYNALGRLESGKYNVAIGYNACSELQKGSHKTCIGYNSGPKKKSSSLRVSGSHNKSNSGSAFLLWGGTGDGDPINDEVERVYIGGTPRNYGGDAVLEIHNPGTSGIRIGAVSGSPYRSNTTTVINGNLIVRGRPYFTVGGNLQHFHNHSSYMKNSTQRLYGYKNNEGAYASCTSDAGSYSWGKCPNLKTTSSSSGSSSSSSSSGSSTSGSGGGGGGGGVDCHELQADIDNASNEQDRHNAQMYFATVCSDRRLKNISDRNYAGLKELRKLKVYNFTFKNDKNKLPQVGVMAQELQKVFPNSVFEDENGYLRIRWDEMFYAAINAIKELDKKIVSLVKRATKVETQITKLEKENVELKAQVESLAARVNKLKTQ